MSLTLTNLIDKTYLFIEMLSNLFPNLLVWALATSIAECTQSRQQHALHREDSLRTRDDFNAPVVTVKNGSLQGVYSREYDQDFFLGVPFAQPPVGSLRFRHPRPLNSTWSGLRSATDYSSHCVGYGGDDWPYPLSEDCLYLNVIRPAGVSPDETLPVAFW
jgi:hypothetical protein